jgi:hypothetical protein
MLNRIEHGIRLYDPCLSCSTHAVGQMPMVVEVYDAAGAMVDQVTRGCRLRNTEIHEIRRPAADFRGFSELNPRVSA